MVKNEGGERMVVDERRGGRKGMELGENLSMKALLYYWFIFCVRGWGHWMTIPVFSAVVCRFLKFEPLLIAAMSVVSAVSFHGRKSCHLQLLS